MINMEVIHTVSSTPRGVSEDYYNVAVGNNGDIEELSLSELKSLSDFLSDYVKKQLNSQIDKRDKDEK